MSKKNIDHSVESRVCFEQLEEWVREQIQFYVQELLEDEVTQLLGRRKNERRREVDASGGYRNGYGKERRLTMSCGTIKLRRPECGIWKSVLRAGSCRCLPSERERYET